MKLSELLEKLPDWKPRLLAVSDKDIHIYHVKRWSSSMGEALEPNILYLCRMKELSGGMDKEGITLLILTAGREEHPLPVFGNFCRANLIHAHTGIQKESFSILLHTVESLLTRHQALGECLHEVLESLHRNEGLTAMLARARDYLENPVFLFDGEYRLLASSLPDSFNPEIRPAPEADGRDVIMTDLIKEVTGSSAYERAKKLRTALLEELKDGSGAKIIRSVYIHGIAAATLVSFDAVRKFTSDDLQMVNYLEKLIAFELQKSDFYRFGESIRSSSFLSDLLENRTRDVATILRRMQSLNWNLSEYLRIMTIIPEYSEIFDKKSQRIVRELQKIFSRHKWVAQEGRIVFLLSLDSPNLDSLRKNRPLFSFLQNNQLIASFSRSFDSITETRRFYHESLAAFQLGKRIHPRDTVYFYRDYMCYHIAGLVAERENLHHFLHPAIEKIRTYDKRHNSSLLQTLSLYLRYPDNPGLAAGELYIHKNTLFYRIAKIRETFSLDLSDGEERLSLHLSLKFLEMLNGNGS